MKKIRCLKSNKGITMLTLTITIVIMLILSFTISINVRPYEENTNFGNFETDIIRLKEEISHYYMQNKNIPIANKYITIQRLEKNPNDNENYYVIDLSKLGNLELNYGKDFEKITDYSQEISDLLDIYIINEQSHTIYYPKGIEHNGKIQFTTMNLDSLQIEDMTIQEVQIKGKNKGTINEEIQLTATVTPIFVQNTGVNWSSSNEDLATVNQNGKVTLKAVGTVRIIATSKDDNTIIATHQIEIVKSELEQLQEEEKYVSVKTKVKDVDGNIVTIPKGFKIAEDSGKTVTEGIVIEDNDIIDGIGNNRGNQYVWIPVGEEIKKSDGTVHNITLGRYIFADGTNHKADDGSTILEEGTPILKQSIDNYMDETDSIKILSNYYEVLEQRNGVESTGVDGVNTTALSIEDFKNSVQENGGYYIARYEASYGIDGKANSKISNTCIDDTIAPTEEGTLWNNITQINAAVASREIYNTIKTDLINSYAWDTAIVYIQEFSSNKAYSYQDGYSINSQITNTGINNDELCKINDMASNTFEWTTEYANIIKGTSSFYCTRRGGWAESDSHYTSSRGGNGSVHADQDRTFRVILYM